MPPGLDLLLMIVIFGAIMYFLMIRPQQKRMREHQEMVNAVEPGTRVLLTSGIYATVLHMGERQMIVEVAPGVEITVVKGHISKVVTDDDEEFVYEGEGNDVEADLDDTVATDEELDDVLGKSEESDDPYTPNADPQANR
ncbi:preprotein translocase subunit YajC [uncultured Tessaracoccus sp.]|uniref:preprotein translocase subunit YajC n=1 Tax=uncultured Tessaracoccus sp. TaxID=905023 RepID=UPI00260F193A|nr:preprotein translocase subunit YajC [uncultured Tessaracoccus sp.]